MATYPIDQMKTKISDMTMDRLSAGYIAQNFVDNRFQAESEGKNEIDIRVFRSQLAPDAIKLANQSRDTNWATAREDAMFKQTLKKDRYITDAYTAKLFDVAELPLNVLEQMASIAAKAVDNHTEDDVYDMFENNIIDDNKEELGSGITVNDKGVAASTAASDLYEWMEDLELKAYDTGFGPDSETPFNKFIVMNPQLLMAVRRWFRAQKYAESATLRTLTSGDVVAGNGRFVRAVTPDGTMVYVSSRVPQQVTNPITVTSTSTNVQGAGIGAEIYRVTISSNEITAIKWKKGGSGYHVGDTLTFTQGSHTATYTIATGDVNEYGVLQDMSSKTISATSFVEPTSKWQVFGGTNRALTYVQGVDASQLWDPETNQIDDQPGWHYRFIQQYGRTMFDDRQAFMLTMSDSTTV